MSSRQRSPSFGDHLVEPLAPHRQVERVPVGVGAGDIEDTAPPGRPQARRAAALDRSALHRGDLVVDLTAPEMKTDHVGTAGTWTPDGEVQVLDVGAVAAIG